MQLDRLALSAAAVLALAGGVASAQAPAPGFYYIGVLGGQGDELAFPQGIANGGAAVVGYDDISHHNSTFRRAFLWTPSAGLRPLPGTPASGTASEASGISADGSIIVGRLGADAFRQTMLGAFDTLNPPPGLSGGAPAAITPDGQIAVGRAFLGSAYHAVRWSPQAEDLGLIADGPLSWARAVSADGSVVVGTAGQALFGPSFAVRWVGTHPPESLGVLPGCGWSEARGVSGDGSVIVGYCLTTPAGVSSKAFRWTAQTGMTELPPLHPGERAYAWSISQDGRLVAGLSGDRSVVWKDGVPYDLNALAAQVAPSIAPFAALADRPIISPDGRAVASADRVLGPSGTEYHAWMLVLPESFTCPTNCDGSTAAPVLNVNDFLCFQARFAAGDPYANCDQSTTPPELNINDFVCFQSRFAAGCP
jgi:uncharacterized membrane protein